MTRSEIEALEKVAADLLGRGHIQMAMSTRKVLDLLALAKGAQR